MPVTKVRSDHSIEIPESLRQQLPAGEEVVITVDSCGRMVVTPVTEILAALQDTFGMWADRDDVARDGVEYVQTIRRGHRLNDFLEQVDESD